jgi:quercetin dioxygenase-like cupin family protein
MKRLSLFMLSLLALVPAAAPAAPATAPGTCAIAYGPAAIPNDAAHQAVVIRMDIAPGRTANWHSHPGAEYVSVTSGSGWLETQGAPRVEMKPGGVYAIAPKTVHRAHNASATNHLVWTGFFVDKMGSHQHTMLHDPAGKWTPGCPTRI